MTQRCSLAIAWSPEDSEYVGTCAELPSLSHQAATEVEALAGIKALVEEVEAEIQANGETLPTVH